MRVLDAIKIARWRFAHVRGYSNREKSRAQAWRAVVRNVKMLCEKRDLTLKDFPGA